MITKIVIIVLVLFSIFQIWTNYRLLKQLEERPYSFQTVTGNGLPMGITGVGFTDRESLMQKIEMPDPFFNRHECSDLCITVEDSLLKCVSGGMMLLPDGKSGYGMGAHYSRPDPKHIILHR